MERLDIAATAQIDGLGVWFENTDGRGRFGPVQVIASFAKARRIVSADMDADGDLDLVVAGFSSGLFVLHNLDGRGTWGPLVDVSLRRTWDVLVVDCDLDGDLDIVSSSDSDDVIVWHSNDDGRGMVFGPETTITSSVDRPLGLAVGDLNGDGRLDLVSASGDDDTIAWYPSTSSSAPAPAPVFGTQAIISTAANYAFFVDVSDGDGDGDLDVFSASNSDGKVAWYENQDGAASFGGQNVLGVLAGARCVFSVDVDGDGDLDVVAGGYYLNAVRWFSQQSRSTMSVYRPQVRVLDRTVPECRDTPFAFVCVAANIMRMSRCVRDVLLLPPGVYSCAKDAHMVITWAIEISSLDVTLPAVFDCAINGSDVGGVLFAAAPSPTVTVSTVGNILLSHIHIRNMGVARVSKEGSPGLRSSGSGTVLSLDHVVISNSDADISVNRNIESAGIGGSAAALDGGSLVVSSSSVVGSRADSTGGVFGVRGVGSSLHLTNVSLSLGFASEGGGCVYVESGSTGVLTSVDLSECGTGTGGLGGALAIQDGARVEVINSTVRSNTGGAGGGDCRVRGGRAFGVGLCALFCRSPCG